MLDIDAVRNMLRSLRNPANMARDSVRRNLNRGLMPSIQVVAHRDPARLAVRLCACETWDFERAMEYYSQWPDTLAVMAAADTVVAVNTRGQFRLVKEFP